MENLLDAELVKRAQKGEGQAFDILVQRYQSRVMQLVFRYVHNTDTALDLVQDIFFKIFRNLVKFKGDSKFSSWLFRIAVNDCIDHLRRIKVRREQSLSHYQESGFDVADPDDSQDILAQYEAEDERRRVRSAMDQLPPKQKSVVVMKVYQDMTFEQISEILEEPVSTVKSRLYKALNTLGGLIRRGNFIERGIS